MVRSFANLSKLKQDGTNLMAQQNSGKLPLESMQGDATLSVPDPGSLQYPGYCTGYLMDGWEMGLSLAVSQTLRIPILPQPTKINHNFEATGTKLQGQNPEGALCTSKI